MINHYKWGLQDGQADPDSGSGVPAGSDYGAPEVFTGALAGDVTLTFTRATKSVTIHNTHDSEHLEASLDGGLTWIDFGPYGERTYDVSIQQLMLRLVAGNSSYAVVGVLS
ncbi:MAG: hypothetical protein WC444_04965 [Candidatus Paceibacterota bacterium]